MAIGTSQSFVLKRNQIIREALITIRTLQADEEPTAAQLDRGVQKLNAILREEDLLGVGQNRNLWAIKTAYLFLVANQLVYTTSTTDGFASDVLEPLSMEFRNSSGDDNFVNIIGQAAYEQLTSKTDNGDVSKVFLKPSRLLADQTLTLNLSPSSTATTSEVAGTDGLNYKCVLKHTSATVNKPVTGGSYTMFWTQAGTAGAAWVTDTAYTNGELLRYTYKRPLFNFSLPTDNPDMPLGWDRYLVLRLAHDLAPGTGLALDERSWLRGEYRLAREAIFPSTTQKTTTAHDKALYY